MFSDSLLLVALVAAVGVGVMLFRTIREVIRCTNKKYPEPYKRTPSVFSQPVRPLVIPDHFPSRPRVRVSPIVPKDCVLPAIPCVVTCNLSLQPVFVVVSNAKSETFIIFPDVPLPFVRTGKQAMMVAEGGQLCLQPIEEPHAISSAS